jgi:hypothetical protein
LLLLKLVFLCPFEEDLRKVVCSFNYSFKITNNTFAHGFQRISWRILVERRELRDYIVLIIFEITLNRIKDFCRNENKITWMLNEESFPQNWTTIKLVFFRFCLIRCYFKIEVQYLFSFVFKNKITKYFFKKKFNIIDKSKKWCTKKQHANVLFENKFQCALRVQ